MYAACNHFAGTQRCWSADPCDRPTMEVLLAELGVLHVRSTVHGVTTSADPALGVVAGSTMVVVDPAMGVTETATGVTDDDLEAAPAARACRCSIS